MTTLEEVFIKVAEIGSAEEREANRQFSRQLSTERSSRGSFEAPQHTHGSVNVPEAPIRKGYSRDSAIQGERAFFFVSVTGLRDYGLARRRSSCIRRLQRQAWFV